MKQTAVEWLELNLLGLISFDSEELRVKYKERVAIAKEMEKQQLKEMYLKGIENYDPTFKRK
jgi:hypothetical protein